MQELTRPEVGCDRDDVLQHCLFIWASAFILQISLRSTSYLHGPTRVGRSYLRRAAIGCWRNSTLLRYTRRVSSLLGQSDVVSMAIYTDIKMADGNASSSLESRVEERRDAFKSAGHPAPVSDVERGKCDPLVL